MNKFIFILFLSFVLSNFIFAEGEKTVFIDKIFVESPTFENINKLYGDVNTFKNKYQNYLTTHFNYIEKLDDSFKLIDKKENANFIIDTKISLESDSLKFVLSKTDKDGKLLDTEKIFYIYFYEDRDHVSDIEYNAKSILYEFFGIYWLKIIKNEKKGISSGISNDLFNQITQEILKTKKALIFDPEKDKKIALALSKTENITVQEIQQIAPFLYVLTIDLEKLDANFNINIDLSKGGSSFNSKTTAVSQTDYDIAFNEGKTIEKITDLAYAIMNVYNADYFNEKITEIKNISSLKGDFKLAKKRLDDLEKKYIDKEDYQQIIKEYSQFLIKADKSMIEVKKKNPLAIFPTVFGGIFLASGITGGVFTYLYFDNQTNSEKSYDLYKLAKTKGDAANYRTQYLGYIDSMNLDMGMFIAFFSLGGVSLITGIIGLSVQLAIINTNKAKLMNEGKKLKFYQKLGFILDYDFKSKFNFGISIKF
ncbi:MAG: hypothetical protein A2086_15345 [Spirochaetes bacterium GWD1_27_9]|nr:MAG: hypothetical protein A2Z98_13580 [Spirochaetes bacterium GWB1_27_13]OHD24347.1 MAG: hypothetical protein A2Y34_00535 [Spirochaetes bacterium GWC1_27_15]OHD34767.1 MAG: hypothetical protein A2086_15345 [Spirochaetes bacterium GWD1_27_9]